MSAIEEASSTASAGPARGALQPELIASLAGAFAATLLWFGIGAVWGVILIVVEVAEGRELATTRTEVIHGVKIAGALVIANGLLAVAAACFLTGQSRLVRAVAVVATVIGPAIGFTVASSVLNVLAGGVPIPVVSEEHFTAFFLCVAGSAGLALRLLAWRQAVAAAYDDQTTLAALLICAVMPPALVFADAPTYAWTRRRAHRWLDPAAGETVS